MTTSDEPPFLHRAEKYLEANAAQRITMGELAEVVGVSVRVLEEAFLLWRGLAPMELVRERRFAKARETLLADARKSVTTVALDCGFEHLGRFSTEYRARFGETPSETRRRASAA